MSGFDHAFEEIIGLEGEYSNDPVDPGGETKWGISKRAYPTLDIPNLSLMQAKAIYKFDYWNPMRLDEVFDSEVAAEIFEQAVNMGRNQACKNAQDALNYFGAGLERDGIIGPATLKALNTWAYRDRTATLKALNGVQFMKYLEIVTAKPELSRFSRGWLRRIQI